MEKYLREIDEGGSGDRVRGESRDRNTGEGERDGWRQGERFSKWVSLLMEAIGVHFTVEQIFGN